MEGDSRKEGDVRMGTERQEENTGGGQRGRKGFRCVDGLSCFCSFDCIYLESATQCVTVCHQESDKEKR